MPTPRSSCHRPTWPSSTATTASGSRWCSQDRSASASVTSTTTWRPGIPSTTGPRDTSDGRCSLPDSYHFEPCPLLTHGDRAGKKPRSLGSVGPGGRGATQGSAHEVVADVAEGGGRSWHLGRSPERHRERSFTCLAPRPVENRKGTRPASGPPAPPPRWTSRDQGITGGPTAAA